MRWPSSTGPARRGGRSTACRSARPTSPCETHRRRGRAAAGATFSTGRTALSPGRPQVIGTVVPQARSFRIGGMAATNRSGTAWRRRRHGVRLEPDDRRALERSGWRTTLEYRENHVRGRDGTLLEIVPAWTAEAER